ncbi:MAG: DUF4834 family protein [Lutibacter sp.]|jgi:hypothetical protein|nr:DUF4834 family protein [Lutibacter sp.]MDO9593599.1 DUF4834 family protein [Lutibacter sp.]MDP2067772.1 DUF4834 family protein [Lutibacter sp.]MDP3359626.1 DUF4834 family protein [Lutibacter sp.]MDP3945857.1 DUF4834 family protein [Lutibacter sp.]
MGFLRTLAIIVIIYYAIKFIGRYILPLFVGKIINNVEKKMRDQQQQFNNQQQNTTGKVGETVIAKKPSDYKEGNKDIGDYVDYEEVKDDK